MSSDILAVTADLVAARSAVTRTKGMAEKGYEPPVQAEPVVGVPVDQCSARDTLAVVSEGFCVPHDVVFVLQQNINPRSTEVYNIIDSAGAPQFRYCQHGFGTLLYLGHWDGETTSHKPAVFRF